MRHSTGEMMRMMHMQQHFAGQTRDRQLGLMNAVLGDMAKIQSNQSSQLVQQMKQQALVVSDTAAREAQASKQLALTLSRGLRQEEQRSASAGRRAIEANDRANVLSRKLAASKDRPRMPPLESVPTPQGPRRRVSRAKADAGAQEGGGAGVAFGLGAVVLAVVAMSR